MSFEISLMLSRLTSSTSMFCRLSEPVRSLFRAVSPWPVRRPRTGVLPLVTYRMALEIWFSASNWVLTLPVV